MPNGGQHPIQKALKLACEYIEEQTGLCPVDFSAHLTNAATPAVHKQCSLFEGTCDGEPKRCWKIYFETLAQKQ